MPEQSGTSTESVSTLPEKGADSSNGAFGIASATQNAISGTLASPGSEGLRTQLLDEIRRDPTQKINTLSERLTSEKMQQLIRCTRETYYSMDSAKSALACLDAALRNAVLLKHLDATDAQELSALARHTMGLYLNTHQYHNAVHVLSMTRETLHLAEIVEICDPEALRSLVIAGLYHDTGNGIHPEPATSKDADEAQAVAIFMRDVHEAERRIKQKEDVGSLAALAKLGTVETQGENVSQVELIGACIAATVFRDRFAPADSLAFQEYMNAILVHIHSTSDADALPIRDLRRMTRLMESAPAWIARDADVVGSTFETSIVCANLLNRGEDVLRGFADKVGPRKYHNGFIGFLGAAFYKGQDTGAVETAREGSPLYLPKGEGNDIAIAKYGKEQLLLEKKRFETVMSEHGSMLTILFVLIGEAAAKGESFLALPLQEVHNRLAQFSRDPERVQRAKSILKEEEITSLDIDLDAYPLLKDARYQELAIPAMTPGLINRIFTPNSHLTEEQAEVAEKLSDIVKNCDPVKQPILFNVLELANMHPEQLKRTHFTSGQTIIEKNKVTGLVFILLEGAASVKLNTNNEERQITVYPGEVLGEVSALTGKGATADVVATTDIECISLPAHLVKDEYHTEILRIRMLKIMEERLRQDEVRK